MNDVDGMVQRLVEAVVDARATDDRLDLADSLSNHHADVWLCIRASDQKKTSMVRHLALRHQSCGEPDLHADSVWHAKLAVGCCGYSDRLGDDHLDDGSDLEAPQMGCNGAVAILHLGVDCLRVTTQHHMDESLIVVSWQSTSKTLDVALPLFRAVC